jgi:aminoglycoside phosphotransferase (APT) family kinase protein
MAIAFTDRIRIEGDSSAVTDTDDGVRRQQTERPDRASLQMFWLSRLNLALGQHYLAVQNDAKAAHWICQGFANVSRQLWPKLVQACVGWVIDQPEATRPHVLAQLVAILKARPELQDLSRELLAQTHLVEAFEAYQRGNTKHVPKRALRAALHRPILLLNRGLLSITARSLIQPRETNTQAHTNSAQDLSVQHEVDIGQPEVLEQIFAEIESTLAHPISQTKPLSGGFSSDLIYKVTVAEKHYVLRVIKHGSLDDFHGRELAEDNAVRMPRHIVSHARQNGVPAWFLQEFIEGDRFQNLNCDDDALMMAALGSLARVLRKLHAIRVEGFGPIYPNTTQGRLPNLHAWLDEQMSFIERGCRSGVIPESSLSSLAQAAGYLASTNFDTPSLCHSDLSGRNIKITGPHVTGIIDWESACGCDPAWDLAGIVLTLNTMCDPATAARHAHTFLRAYDAEHAGHLLPRTRAFGLLLAGLSVTDMAFATDPYLVLVRDTALELLRREMA